MTNKEFDLWLRDSLSSVQPDLNPKDWDQFVQRVEESESQLDSGFDDAIRNAVTDVGAGATPDWSRMEQHLNADELNFDQHVKQTIGNFEVPYNPNTWPTLHARLSEDERIRRRLVHVKILEIVAILIVFLTFYNFFPTFKSSVIEPAEDLLRKELSKKESAMNLPDASVSSENTLLNNTSSPSAVPGNDVRTTSSANHEESRKTDASTNDAYFTKSSFDQSSETPIVNSATSSSENFSALVTDGNSVPVSGNRESMVEGLLEDRMPRTSVNELASLHSASQHKLFLSNPTPGFMSVTAMIPVLMKPSRVRFGMMAAADVNTLFFPEEHFYSQGRSINFSEKEIVAGGYSAGASLLFDSKRFFIETGLTYSSKNFGPDRKLFIGSSTDRHTLDFENITVNSISIPLYLHLKIDGKGSWRVYTTSGASMHVIANAHYDLFAENVFTSSAAPQNPQQLQNEREVQRVREHMLDGAKFSTKGYVTVGGGFGVERYLNPRMSIFVQPMYHYQIQFFGLFDRNGKHLQNGSLLLGTRITL